MTARLRSLGMLATCTVGALTAGVATTHAHAHADAAAQPVMLQGTTTASYFWDDASGRAGDTGLPAVGKPMQEGLVASPSWPLMTKGYVVYKGRKLPFFVGDRGPGNPSNSGVMLDLDAKTFAKLTGGTFNPETLEVEGTPVDGHIKVDYVITRWGDGVGLKGYPVAFSTGAWARRDSVPVRPLSVTQPSR
ncbi:hypothetical protein [Nonomuraea jiangxiensis]|uniref:Uncharacterized protein n=1 Tax=Nonomuraea jiangxiensis TaxID=633440 RepID=A0A1G9DEW7_9ACTN|nr:hypothetical protein [Nonomuraea jiangxiensis]SDK62411.1 hypothetical protein SAMN05421869_117116 [Nonomuraea jiangxiensis]